VHNKPGWPGVTIGVIHYLIAFDYRNSYAVVGYLPNRGIISLQDAIPFEKLKSDLIDHILAILNEFELKIFQRPTGEDFVR
jgi:hypothetical protein